LKAGSRKVLIKIQKLMVDVKFEEEKEVTRKALSGQFIRIDLSGLYDIGKLLHHNGFFWHCGDPQTCICLYGE
jgi:hypothetical protein